MEMFDAKPKSIIELFSLGGSAGYYIPAYQREYSWDSTNHVTRFLEDICIGINTFLEYKDSVTFIGSIISIKDTECKTIKPFIRGHLPSEVMTLIDGQQRITTIALMSTVLHNLLSINLYKLNKKDEPIRKWFLNKSGQLIHNLTIIYQLDRHGSDTRFKLFPKIIRAYTDQWSIEGDNAKYESPVAKYLFSYIDFVREQNNQPKKNFPINSNNIKNKKVKNNKVEENVKFLKKKITDIISNKYEDLKSLDLLKKIVQKIELEKRFFNEDIPKEIKLLIDKDNIITETLSLFIIINFFLNNVAVTAVVAKNESYAFDIFEALNTTGEPLTALETFKPKVIEAEKIEYYENSDSRKYIDFIDNTLSKYLKAEEKQKATSKILTPFRLLFEGEKLSKHLSAQRRFLSKAYDSCSDIGEKQKFVKIMCDLTDFLERIWSDSSNGNPEFNQYCLEDKELVMLCLKVLIDSNHIITIPLIARYYIYAKAQNYSKESLEEFGKSVKAIAAFFVLWRASRPTTGGIDECYRELMKHGYNYKHNDGTIVKKVVAKFSMLDSPDKPPLVNDLQEAFRFILHCNKISITNKDSWVKKSVIQPLVTINKQLTRFMLLISSHDTTPKDCNYGTIICSVENVKPMLNINHWNNYSTIEHIWPQSPTDTGWCEDLKNLDCDIIGNLTLLPKSENSSLSARDWNSKKIIYQILSAKTKDERSKYLELAKDKDIEISTSTSDIISSSHHFPQLEAISKIDTFNKQCVEQRGECLASIIWDRVSSWLDYPEENQQ